MKKKHFPTTKLKFNLATKHWFILQGVPDGHKQSDYKPVLLEVSIIELVVHLLVVLEVRGLNPSEERKVSRTSSFFVWISVHKARRSYTPEKDWIQNLYKQWLDVVLVRC
jgi:hypothetical protein